jgi:hypothetical protein
VMKREKNIPETREEVEIRLDDLFIIEDEK